MRQSNNGTITENISMEEYLEKRQEQKRLEILQRTNKRRAAEWSAALEIVNLYV